MKRSYIIPIVLVALLVTTLLIVTFGKTLLNHQSSDNSDTASNETETATSEANATTGTKLYLDQEQLSILDQDPLADVSDIPATFSSDTIDPSLD